VLSLGADLGLGQPVEHAMRQCLIALRLAERLGVDESDRRVIYYNGLLAWVGCHVDAYEEIRDSLSQTFERRDGKGVPAEAKGEELTMCSRLVTLADVVRNQPRMFTARATTSPTVTSAATPCTAMTIFAVCVSGMVSVGLNAVAFVSEV
jgi:hypothetical protein